MEISVGIVRAACLFLPILAFLDLCLWLKPSKSDLTGALLAFLWNLPSVFALHLISIKMGWWKFEASGGLLLGMPVELLISWCILWGAIPIIAFPRLKLFLLGLVMVAFDFLFMPLLEPLLMLNSSWVFGEIAGIIFCLVPSQLLGRWARDNQNLPGRTILQVICFSGLAGFLLPIIIGQLTNSSVSELVDKPLWLSAIYFQLVSWSAVIGVSAVQEFAILGKGTPFPYDPPKRLVTTGLYRYVRNPMQISMVLSPAFLGAWISNYWVIMIGPMAIVYGIGFANWSEDEDLSKRFAESWAEYKARTRAWFPALSPQVQGIAILYYAQSCGICSELADRLIKLKPIGVKFVPAELHPTRNLSRITYELPEECIADEGIVAIARLLEHVNLVWAILGSFMRLPIISTLLQFIADSIGGEERFICRTDIGD